MKREKLAMCLGALLFKRAAVDVKATYNRGDPETAGGDLAYKGKQWMDMPDPTSGSNAPMERVRELVEKNRLRKKGPMVSYEEVT